MREKMETKSQESSQTQNAPKDEEKGNKNSNEDSGLPHQDHGYAWVIVFGKKEKNDYFLEQVPPA